MRFSGITAYKLDCACPGELVRGPARRVSQALLQTALLHSQELLQTWNCFIASDDIRLLVIV